MSIGFSSAARNLFLLGSSGEQVVTNFFKTIDQSAGTDGAYIPDEIKYNFVDQKFVLAGSAHDSNTKGFGWFEKRDQAGSTEWDVRVEAGVGVNTTLRAMELDVNDNLIVVGGTGDVPWIAKYSNGGVIDWQSTTNTADVEYTGITSDSNGNYYACGSTVLVEKTAFVEKFDTNGNPGWGKAAFMLGRDVVLYNIAANSRGEVVAVGYLEDNLYYKGYIVKIDTNTGEVLWDRTLQTDDYLECTDVYIDSNDQIYVTAYKGSYFSATSYLIKYTAEGNIIWQRETDNDTSADETIIYQQVHSDGETEQTVVFGTYKNGSGDEGGVLSKYSKDGSLVWRRTLFSTYNNSDSFGVLIKRGIALDADPSFYYLLFVDDVIDELNGTPDRYTYGKVSSSGNGLGAFSYSPDAFDALDYIILSVGDKIGRLSDGSVRQDTSDLITYPFNANKILFDDLATQVSNKKRQMDDADSFEYSGSPAIRPADFQELNLLGDNVSGRIWNDTSGKGNNGVTSLTEPFLGAGSTSFDGTGDNLRVSTSGVFNYGTSNFTIEFWWYRTSNERQALFHGSWGQDWSIGIDFNGASNNQKLGIWASSNGTSWDMLIADAGGNGITTGTPTLNAWNHIAYVRNGTTFTLYLNGINVGQVTGISASINSKTTSREQVIGAWWNSEIAMSDVHGYLSNYRIVIGSALYTSNFTPPTTQLTNIPGTVLLTCQGDTIADASANNFTITANGNASPTDDGPTWNASGYWEFDGTNKKISVPYNEVWTLPNDFTLEAWIYRNSAFNANWWQDAIMGHDDGSGQNNKWIFSHNGTSLFFHTNTTSGSAQNIQAPTGWVPTNSVWYNVVITRSENTYTFYQNSTSLGTVTNSEAIPVASASLTIGNAEGGGLFDGRIGEVRIYPRALTAAQVFQNYNATREKYTGVPASTDPGLTSTRTPA
jgi:hypothetical protein